MRGKIIQYNTADGSGTIVADGKQYRFELATWRGDSAPAVNKTVEVQLDADTVTVVAPVGEDVLLKERAAQWSGKLGSAWKKNVAANTASATGTATAGETVPAGVATPGAQAVPASGPAGVAGAIIARYGKAILIAWALFVIGSLMFNAITVSFGPTSFGKSLFAISSLLSQYGVNGGGGIKLMLILGYLSIGVPYVWADRRAWLALTIPLLAMVWAMYSAISALSSLGGMAGQGGPSVFDFIGFGFYLSLLAAIALAVLAFAHFARGR